MYCVSICWSFIVGHSIRMASRLKHICSHFDETFVIGCIGGNHNDNSGVTNVNRNRRNGKTFGEASDRKLKYLDKNRNKSRHFYACLNWFVVQVSHIVWLSKSFIHIIAPFKCMSYIFSDDCECYTRRVFARFSTMRYLNMNQYSNALEILGI